MTNQKTLRRYYLIIELVEKNRYPSNRGILNYLEAHDIDISERSLERDRQNIRDEFGVYIIYDRTTRGYYIDKDASPEFDAFLRFLEIASTAHLLTDSLAKGRDALKYISFDMAGGLKNIELLKPLLEAVTQNRTVSFEHLNYKSGKLKKFTIEPYLLKEYRNRWYITGRLPKTDTMLTFGIDRIANLTVNTKKFTYDEDRDPKYNFLQIIGVEYKEAKMERIVLSFTEFQGKYIKSLPIHYTQKTLIDDANEFRIEITVIPNYELIQYILMHNHNVKVLEPEWLAAEVKERLKKTLDQY